MGGGWVVERVVEWVLARFMVILRNRKQAWVATARKASFNENEEGRQN